jgi:hypothetical protein
LAFIGCVGFYAALGTLLASLIAWSLILIATAGTVLVSMVSHMIGDPGSSVGAVTAAGLGAALLSLVVTGAVGYVAAPFVGVLIGWKSAIVISLAMGLAWCRSGTRPYTLWLSPFMGALGTLLISPPPFTEHGGGILIGLGIAFSSALSAVLATWIFRYWLEPDRSALPA